MKRAIALILALVMAMALVACGSGGDTNTPSTSDKPAASTSTTPSNPASSGTTTPTTPADPEAARYGGVLNIHTHAPVEHFDPHVASAMEAYKWSTGVFETPLSMDASGNICPNVCEYEISDDGLTLKLKVREGITFHDGSAVEIEDVVASLERSGRLSSNVKKNFAAYTEKVEVKDGVATYTFNKYSPNTLYYIATYQPWAAVMPKEICEKYGDNTIIEVADTIGTGPYKLAAYEPSVAFKTVRYEDYKPVPEGHDGQAGPKKAYLDEINVLVNRDATSTATAMMSGEYDVSDEISVDYQKLLLGQGYQMLDAKSSKTCYLAFNTKGDRPVNDPNLRKAIACLVDIDAFIEVATTGVADYDGCPVPKGNQYYSDKFMNADYVGKNVEKAKEYLAKSNYKGEEIVILAAKYEECCVLLESYMREFGLNVKLLYMEQAAATAFWTDNSNPYDIMIAGSTQVTSYPALVPAALKSTYWGNERKDELFKQLALEPIGSENSHKLWTELVDLWVDDASIVCLFSFSEPFVGAPGLNLNNPAMFFPAFYDAYWDNPSAHMN